VLIFIVMTCRIHIFYMFDEMPFMATRGPVNSLFNYLLVSLFQCNL